MENLFPAAREAHARLDGWLTFAGWMWVLYLALIAATGSALLFT
jgi:hypothetical protein